MLNLKPINDFAGYSLLLVAAYLIFFTDYNYLLVLPLFPLFAIFRLIYHYDTKNKCKIPEYYYTSGLIAIYMAVFGEFFFEFYYNWIYYDKLLHLLVSIYLILVINIFVHKDLRFRILWVFLVVIGICVAWEIFEYLIDTISNTTLLRGVFIDMKELTGGFEDTMIDTIFNIIGAAIGTIFLSINSKLQKIECKKG